MKISRLITFTLIATVIIDVFRYLSYMDELGLNSSTYISSFLSYLSLFLIGYFGIKYKESGDIFHNNLRFYRIWLIWGVFNIVRGALIADNYWDYKFLLLSSLPFTLISLLFFIGSNLFLLKKIINSFLKWFLIPGLLLIPISLATNPELYSRIMIPISLFILIMPFLKSKWKLLILIVTIISISLAIGFRANLIKIFISFLLLSIYYFPGILRLKFIKTIHLILFLGPVILFGLGVSGAFNIFSQIEKDIDSFTTTTNRDTQISFTNDSRTFLYTEILADMGSLQNWVIGKSASGSYHSLWFYDGGGAMNGKRYRTEVNILNILLYHGVIGVVIYFILLFKVSSLAIKYSHNDLGKMLGLFIASRWMLSFLEEFTQYDLNFYFFWLVMGLISSKTFLAMDNNDLREYFKYNEIPHSRSSYLS